MLDRLFPQIPVRANSLLDVSIRSIRVQALLSANALFYLVVLAANDPDEICTIMQKQGFQGKVAQFQRSQSRWSVAGIEQQKSIE